MLYIHTVPTNLFTEKTYVENAAYSHSKYILWLYNKNTSVHATKPFSFPAPSSTHYTSIHMRWNPEPGRSGNALRLMHTLHIHSLIHKQVTTLVGHRAVRLFADYYTFILCSLGIKLWIIIEGSTVDKTCRSTKAYSPALHVEYGAWHTPADGVLLDQGEVERTSINQINK